MHIYKGPLVAAKVILYDIVTWCLADCQRCGTLVQTVKSFEEY